MTQIIIEAENEDITELAQVLKEAGWKLDFGRAVGVSDADYVIMRGGQDKAVAAG
ncbi:MAG TPA: hypothetical protein VH478_17335 [Trebonia sp.]|jgi:hypothetical protein|nr:hypothetical protein [Trebonia sp.]